MSTTEIVPPKGTEETSQRSIAPAKPSNGDNLGLLSALVDTDAWNRMVKMSEIFAKSTLVPEHFRGNVGNCIIGLQLAMRMQVDPFMLMQNMYIVHGKPGLEAKVAIAMCNSKGVFRGPIRYELSGEGKERKCVAYAFDKETGERCEETVTIEIAEKEGWTTKKGSKWLTIPDLMLKYRSAMWLIRTTCPEVLMGMQSTDELVDIAPVVIEPEAITDDRPKSEQLADELESKLNGNSEQPNKRQSTFELYRDDMHKAVDSESLAAVTAAALAESQAGGMSMDEWKELLALSNVLKKSFEA